MSTKLRPEQARSLLAAHRKVGRLSADLDAAKTERAELQARLQERVPTGEELQVAGIKVKRVTKNTGRKFQLKGFLEKHKLTQAMAPFVTEPSTYEVWDVKEIPSEEGQ